MADTPSPSTESKPNTAPENSQPNPFNVMLTREEIESLKQEMKDARALALKAFPPKG